MFIHICLKILPMNIVTCMTLGQPEWLISDSPVRQFSKYLFYFFISGSQLYSRWCCCFAWNYVRKHFTCINSIQYNTQLFNESCMQIAKNRITQVFCFVWRFYDDYKFVKKAKVMHLLKTKCVHLQLYRTE